MPEIPYVDLAAQYRAEREQLLPLIDAALATGQWVGGAAVEAFERALEADNAIEHAIAVGSGTDALILSLRALNIGPGDEVITAPNSFVASAAAIVAVGARPVFVDVLADQNMDPERIESALSPRCKAIIPVHLTGRCAKMPEIMALARAAGVFVIEDAAQAYAARLGGQRAGCMGDMGCFSAHPLKNLNAAGDAGFILTRSAQWAARLRGLRNHGLVDRNTVEFWGGVSRLDAIQATILQHRLTTVDEQIASRRRNASQYREQLDAQKIFVPPCGADEFNTFHTFVVQLDDRDRVAAALADAGIGSGIHYPIPIHLQPAARGLGYGPGDFPVAEGQARRILSLPVHGNLDERDLSRVVATIHGSLA